MISIGTRLAALGQHEVVIIITFIILLCMCYLVIPFVDFNRGEFSKLETFVEDVI